MIVKTFALQMGIKNEIQLVVCVCMWGTKIKIE